MLGLISGRLVETARAPALLQQAEKELNTIFPETFAAAPISPNVTPQRSRKNTRAARDDAPQPIRLRHNDTVDEVRHSFSANFVALELLNMRGNSQKAEEYVQRIFASEHIPLGFFTTRAAVDLNRANYEVAHTYLVEARRRYGEQYSMVPAFFLGLQWTRQRAHKEESRGS